MTDFWPTLYHKLVILVILVVEYLSSDVCYSCLSDVKLLLVPGSLEFTHEFLYMNFLLFKNFRVQL